MRTAEVVLEVIRKRGMARLPLDEVYRQLYNPELYLRAYANLYSKKGAMTAGTSPETVDGMSLEKISKLIEELRYERYKWTPVRRVYIEKKNSAKKRALGIPTWSNKLVQDVVRQILEAYYEPQFSQYSHGFRPDRGCHSALSYLKEAFIGTKWFIEGDISQYFDTINHQILVAILRESILDNRFIRLIENLLKAGYLEDWKYKPTLSGTPQGAIVSPILANVYLDKFDKWVEHSLIPQYTRGNKKRDNPNYKRISRKRTYLLTQGETEGAAQLLTQMRKLPSVLAADPEFRRLKYIRYGDDFLLGFIGSKAEALEIKTKIAQFLRDNLKLELSDEKTLITNATLEKARFLGYEIGAMQADDKIYQLDRKRRVNGKIALYVPKGLVNERCKKYLAKGKPIHRPELINDSDYDITVRYQGEYRGLVQYYILAQNVNVLNKLHWIMRCSLLKTLANKHKTSLSKILVKHKAKTKTRDGLRVCLEVKVEREGKPPLTARFGGIPLKRDHKAIIEDKPLEYHIARTRSELIQKLLQNECSLCGSSERIENHHIKKLADLKKAGQQEKPHWVQIMASRQRKAIPVCQSCHDEIHSGKSKSQFRIKSLESRVLEN